MNCNNTYRKHGIGVGSVTWFVALALVRVKEIEHA